MTGSNANYSSLPSWSVATDSEQPLPVGAGTQGFVRRHLASFDNFQYFSIPPGAILAVSLFPAPINLFLDRTDGEILFLVVPKLCKVSATSNQRFEKVDIAVDGCDFECSSVPTSSDIDVQTEV
jgi:hypothetical protein